MNVRIFIHMQTTATAAPLPIPHAPRAPLPPRHLLLVNLQLQQQLTYVCVSVCARVVCKHHAYFLIECAGNWLSRTCTWSWLWAVWSYVLQIERRCVGLFGCSYRYLLAICFGVCVCALWITALDLVRLFLSSFLYCHFFVAFILCNVQIIWVL